MVRTSQVGGIALAVLLGLKATLPPARFRTCALWSGLAVTGGLSAYFVATFAPRTRFPGIPLWTRLPQEQRNAAVALTFDDGPYPETTPRLLDLLDRSGAKATFFLVGERAARHPALVRRIRDEGHALGVHGLRHRTMVLQNASEIARDLHGAQYILENALGAALPGRLLRSPYGFKTWTMARTVHRLGWSLIGWSLDPRDYDPRLPEELTAVVRERLTPGDIVLLHERPDISASLEALPEILRVCRERNLSSVPFPATPYRITRTNR